MSLALLDDLAFELAQFAVGDDEEIARPARGIEQADRGEPVVERAQCRLAPGDAHLGTVELGAEVVEKQRADDAQDTRLGRVVGALLALGDAVDDAFEKCAEDRGRHLVPAEGGGFEQGATHIMVERRRRGLLGEQAAVDIGKGGEVTVERGLPLRIIGVEDGEQPGQPSAEIAAVCRRPLFEQDEELVLRLEDTGVVGEQDEQQAHQQPFEGVAGVPVLA